MSLPTLNRVHRRILVQNLEKSILFDKYLAFKWVPLLIFGFAHFLASKWLSFLDFVLTNFFGFQMSPNNDFDFWLSNEPQFWFLALKWAPILMILIFGFQMSPNYDFDFRLSNEPQFWFLALIFGFRMSSSFDLDFWLSNEPKVWFCFSFQMSSNFDFVLALPWVPILLSTDLSFFRGSFGFSRDWKRSILCPSFSFRSSSPFCPKCTFCLQFVSVGAEKCPKFSDKHFYFST